MTCLIFKLEFMNFIKREKLTLPRVWTSSIPNIEFTQMELLQSEHRRIYRIALEQTRWIKVTLPGTEPVTEVDPGTMENGYPKPLGSAFNGVRSFYHGVRVNIAVYEKTQFMIFHDF